MFAVIRTGGKQYLVKPGQTVTVEKLNIEAGQPVIFDDVLLVGEAEPAIGEPRVKAKVTAKVVQSGLGKKVVTVKFHNKVRYRRTKGHRQPFTKVKIEKIG